MKTILFALAVTFGALAATAADFALAFDGTNDYVRVASAPELTLSNRFTLEFWFKPTNTSQSNAYLLSHNGLNPAGQSAVIYKFSGNAVEFYATGFSGADPRPGSAMIISDTQWHHVAYSYDGTNWNGYLDGLAVFALNRSFSLNTSPNHWFIGCASPGLNLVAGTFDEVRIWNSARSGNEIQQNMNRRLPQSKPGLVGYYKLDEGVGTNTSDNSGHGFSGTLLNGPQWVVSDAPIVPDVITLSATNVSVVSAALNATVNPLGRPASAWFEWGTSTNFGNVTAAADVGAGSTDVSLSFTTGGLTIGQNYFFRIVATNVNGRADGDAGSFTPAYFTEAGVVLTNMGRGQVRWGDYDNDGRLDILQIGISDQGYFSEIWRNTSGVFTNLNAGLPGVSRGSVAWGDYDNDGWLDILLTGDTGTEYISQVWRNTPDGFVNINAGLPGIVVSSATWGDFDNDGRLDILLTGCTSSDTLSQVWRNTPSGFVNINAGLPGVCSGSVACADYDNDGRLDILLTGNTGSERISQVWRNTPAGFVNINAGLPGVNFSSVAWGDYDNDGRLDILLTGNTGAGYITQIWRNTPGGFTNINAGLPGVLDGSAAWGDFDNDGRLDILLSGQSSTGYISQVWRNTPGGFTNIDAGLPGAHFSSVAWGDYDRDGRLDFLLAGFSGSGYSAPISQVWRNNYPTTNAPPIAPNGQTVSVVGPSVLLQWNPAGDSQTPAAGLTYNLRIGTTPNGSDIVAPMAANLGQRRLPQSGNAQLNTHFLLTPTVGTTYYWSVQAIDSAFAGSPFSTEQSFTIGGVLTPANAIPVPGDINGDGKVDEGELNEVLAHYWPDSPFLQMTNVAGLGGTNVTFALTNSVAGAFSVEYTTNFADWYFLGPAAPRYLFTDTNAPAAPQRYYRLRWP